MAPCLSNNWVKAFAKQTVFCDMCQTGVGSAAQNRKPRLRGINQMAELMFLVRVVWRSGVQDRRGTLWYCQGPKLPPSSSARGIPLHSKQLRQDGCSTSGAPFLLQAGERRPRGDGRLGVAKSPLLKSSPRSSIRWLDLHLSCQDCHMVTSCCKGGWSL